MTSMAETRRHGRRRAETARTPRLSSGAPARIPAHRSEPAKGASTGVGLAVKGTLAVAVAGTLMAAGAVAQQVGAGPGSVAGDVRPSPLHAAAPSLHASVPETPGTPVRSGPVSAPSHAAIKFAAPDVRSTPPSTPTSAGAGSVKANAGSVTPVDDPAAAKAFAASRLPSFGWGADQMQCLTLLWQRESEWLTSAENPSSGAYGIAQSLPASKMASAGSDWATNPETQIRWGLGYISGRYGSPCAAWGHSESVGWY